MQSLEAITGESRKVLEDIKRLQSKYSGFWIRNPDMTDLIKTDQFAYVRAIEVNLQMGHLRNAAEEAVNLLTSLKQFFED